MASIVVENVSSAVPRLGLRPILRRGALCVVFVAVCFFIFPSIVDYHTILGSNFKVAASSVHVVKLVDEPSGDAFHTPEVRLAILDYIEGRLVERLHWNLTAGAKNLKLDLSCYYADTADVDGVRVMMNEASDVVCSSNKTYMFPMHSTWHCEMYPNTSSLSPNLVRIGETPWSSLAMSRDTFWSSNSSTLSSEYMVLDELLSAPIVHSLEEGVSYTAQCIYRDIDKQYSTTCYNQMDGGSHSFDFEILDRKNAPLSVFSVLVVAVSFLSGFYTKTPPPPDQCKESDVYPSPSLVFPPHWMAGKYDRLTALSKSTVNPTLLGFGSNLRIGNY